MKVLRALPIRVIFPILALLLSACGDDKLKKVEIVNDLRILEITADKPEANAGDTVILTPYVSDSQGGGRSLTVSREACIDVGVGRGGEPSCEGNPSRVSLGSSTETVGSASDLYTGTLSASSITLPGAAQIFADPATGSVRAQEFRYNGVAYLFFVTVTAPGGESRTAFKRVIVSTRVVKNENPTLNAVRFNGVPDGDSAATRPTVDTPVSVDAPTTGESYTAYADTGALVERTETLSVFWYATEGEFRTSISAPGDTNTYKPPGMRAARTTFIVLIKDDRGGSAVRRVTL